MIKLLKGPLSFRSDWSKRWPDQDAMANLDENGVQAEPWSSRILIHERHVKVMVMRLLIQMLVFQQQNMAWLTNTHLLEQNIYQVEVLNQLESSSSCWCLISPAFHWDKATGSPVCSGYFTLNYMKNTEETLVFFVIYKKSWSLVSNAILLH